VHVPWFSAGNHRQGYGKEKIYREVNTTVHEPLRDGMSEVEIFVR